MYIAICDDDPADRGATEAAVRQYARERQEFHVETCCFSDGRALLDAVAGGRSFAVCLLDVLMPELTGIELAGRLTELRQKTPVIFLTVSPEYALDAFRVSARQYLLKPVQAPALYDTLDSVLSGIKRERPITIPAESGDVYAPLGRITCAECSAHRVRYHMDRAEDVVSRTLRVPFQEAIRPLLDSGRFLQPHRSYAVNVDYIARISGGLVTLRDGSTVPISQLRCAEFKKKYMEFMID